MARPRLGNSATERLHIKITADELEAIDAWRNKLKLPSRSEAVRMLCSSALYMQQKRKIDCDTAIKLMTSVGFAFKALDPGKVDQTMVEMGKLAIEMAATFVDTRPYSYGQMRSSAYQDDATPANEYDEIATVATFVRNILLHSKAREKDLGADK